ncbi:MAG: 3-deoxy-manno-octulosonate cytidylyltransferase [gamma proteobacterium symbiont of Taylorina sp.]|nr:3-deoxy-manno-octulosonate cytidylyltransferase [gamma proteobacterium symbiont of Taylorina sp.]
MMKNSSDFKIVIPARYASSRLPGKPLINIAGKPMIQHTYERARQCMAGEIVIATDDQRIADAVSQFTSDIVMTSKDHNSGTERLAEVVEIKNWDDNTIVVNVQGDEPLVSAEHIELVAGALENNNQAGLSTLATPIERLEDIFDTNIVKVVMDYQNCALYFSRAVIPWDRDSFFMDSKTIDKEKIKILMIENNWFRHIGMYAYRVSTLKKYITLASCSIEKIESLEQLRMLYNGISIHVSIVDDQPGHGVDVEADIAKVEKILNNQ